MPKKPDQALLNLYDRYAHGQISRRSFMQQAAASAVAGTSVAALIDSLENMVSDTFSKTGGGLS